MFSHFYYELIHLRCHYCFSHLAFIIFKNADNFSEGRPLLDRGAERSSRMVSCEVCGIVGWEEQELLLGRRWCSHRDDNRHRQRSVRVRVEMSTRFILKFCPFLKVMSCPEGCLRAWLETSINSWRSLPSLVVHWWGANHFKLLIIWVKKRDSFAFDILGCYKGGREGFWFGLLETCSLQDVQVTCFGLF